MPGAGASQVQLVTRVGGYAEKENGDLGAWLRKHNLADLDSWGQAPGTKPVCKLAEEIRLGETTIELWETSHVASEAGNHKQVSVDHSGAAVPVSSHPQTIPVRCVHVLRAKVCSRESRERGRFLMNTWQQTSKGEYRFRHGLLSEKLGADELPLEQHLFQAGERAVTQEEMARVVHKSTRMQEAAAQHPYDPAAKSPLKVVDVVFQDQCTEQEESKSFPGLLTLYYLYTVDVVCDNLPADDFNTLEYDGKQKLKYVHAWQWTSWELLKLHLFEGSTCRERPEKFDSVDTMKAWLMKHGDSGLRAAIASEWDPPRGGEMNGNKKQNATKSVEDLYREVNAGECSLELWSKRNGVALIVRVVHVLRAKVVHEKNRDLFLFNTFDSSFFENYVETRCTSPGTVSPTATTFGSKVPKNHFLTEKLSKRGAVDVAEHLRENVELALEKRLQKLLSEETVESARGADHAGAYLLAAVRKADGIVDEEDEEVDTTFTSLGPPAGPTLLEADHRGGEGISEKKFLKAQQSDASVEAAADGGREDDISKSNKKIEVTDVQLQGKTYEVEQSRGFPGLLTVYHLYMVNVEQKHLCPHVSSFASLQTAEVKRHRLRKVQHWRWCTWPDVVDLLNRRAHHLEACGKLQEAALQTSVTSLVTRLETAAADFARLHLAGAECEQHLRDLKAVAAELQSVPRLHQSLGEAATLPADVLQSCIVTEQAARQPDKLRSTDATSTTSAGMAAGSELSSSTALGSRKLQPAGKSGSDSTNGDITSSPDHAKKSSAKPLLQPFTQGIKSAVSPKTGTEEAVLPGEHKSTISSTIEQTAARKRAPVMLEPEEDHLGSPFEHFGQSFQLEPYSNSYGSSKVGPDSPQTKLHMHAAMREYREANKSEKFHESGFEC
ncbi:unnamed protein product [Amoebophrya sp. A120]|nr:unnamed protein product [Amoebophrya sp. A120]|eukprot:GSA120T00002758001.1